MPVDRTKSNDVLEHRLGFIGWMDGWMDGFRERESERIGIARLKDETTASCIHHACPLLCLEICLLFVFFFSLFFFTFAATCEQPEDR